MLSTVLILLRSIGKLNKLHRTVCDEENKFLKSNLARVSTQSTFQTKLNEREWCRFDGEDVSQIPTSPVFRFWRQISPPLWFRFRISTEKIGYFPSKADRCFAPKETLIYFNRVGILGKYSYTITKCLLREINVSAR
jgi:hypothetical protein